MSQHPFRILNVFTRPGERFSGNPLAVFEPAAPLDTATMQKLARQMNLSETTFISASSKASAQVRIFTPAYEMPFAGHPTLGTAHVCRSLGLGGDDLVLEMGAGLIPVRAQADRWTLQAQPPSWREVEQTRAELAALVGLEERDLGERPLWVSTGREQLILPVTSAAAVRRAVPSREVFARLETGAGPRQVFVFAMTGPGTASDAITARFFFPDGQAVREDPATGSATANLGGWWLAMGRPLPARIVSSQGEQAGRPSLLTLEVDAARQVFVSGEVLELARGVLTL